MQASLGKVGMTRAEETIYVLNHPGTMYLLDLTDDGFEMVNQLVVERKATHSYLARPVVCDQRLCRRCHEALDVPMTARYIEK